MAEIYVTSTADSGAGSLRQAIADASDGDVILFDNDVFPVGQTTSILLSSYVSLNKSVSIYGGENDGQGGYTSGATKRFYVYREINGVQTKVYIDDETPALDGETALSENVCRVSLDAQNAGRCVRTGTIASASGLCVVSGLELKNGYAATSGGGALFAQNLMRFGLYDCAIVSARTDAGGGGIYVGSNATTNIIDACTFNACTATQNGGAVLLSSSSQNTLRDCLFDGCNSANGGAIDAASTSQNTLNGCIFYGCTATIGGGGIYSTNTSQNTLNNCTIANCSASNGGAIYSASNSQNTFESCTITDCSATNGGGVYLYSESHNILNNCTITNCSASNYGGGALSGSASQNTLNYCNISGCSASTNGGGVYSTNTSQNTLNDCTVSGCNATNGGGVYSTNTSQNTLNGCIFDVLSTVYITNTSALTISGGVTTIASAQLNTATITIADGAALTITTSATIGAATFTSAGRGYLAVGAAIDASEATLTNVVLCAYGADVSIFAEVDGVLEWDAANPTTTVLIERADDDSWSTVTQTAGESLTLYLPPSDTVRLFDGVQFFTAQAPAQRTYYYIGGAEGSFTSAADWSLRRGGVAITEPPVVAGQRFIVGDISSGE